MDICAAFITKVFINVTKTNSDLGEGHLGWACDIAWIYSGWICDICQWRQISGFQGSVHECPILRLRRGVKILMIKDDQLNKIYLI